MADRGSTRDPFFLTRGISQGVPSRALLSLLEQHPRGIAEALAAARDPSSDETPLSLWTATLAGGRDPSNLDLLRKLLELRPDAAGVPDKRGDLVLQTALRNGASLEAISLIAAAFPQGVAVCLGTALEEVNGRWQLQVFQAMLVHNPEVLSRKGNTAAKLLHSALAKKQSSDPALVAFLVAEIDSELLVSDRGKDTLGNLVLHSALKNSAPETLVLQLLQKSTAQCALGDKDGSLPLHLSLLHNHSAAVVNELLHLHPQAVRERDFYGRNPCVIACCSAASVGIVELLLMADPDAAKAVNELQNNSMPLHYAAARGAESPVVEALLRVNPAAAQAADRLGLLPLHLACMQSQPQSQHQSEVIEALLRVYPEAAMVATRNDTCLPLHLAAATGAPPDTMRVLLHAYPAAAGAKNAKGLTPLVALLQADPQQEPTACKTAPALASAMILMATHPQQLPTTILLPNKPSKQPKSPPPPPLPLSSPSSQLGPPGSEARAALGALAQALKPTKEVTPIHIHLIGDSHSGKSTLKNCLTLTLGRPVVVNALAHRGAATVLPVVSAVTSVAATVQAATTAGAPSTLARTVLDPLEHRAHAQETNRTIGMECEKLDRVNKAAHVRFLLHDYGGQREFHVNHSRFLSAPNSIYVIVVALWNVVSSCPVDEEDLARRYAYWLKLVASVAEPPATIVTVLNFRSLAGPARSERALAMLRAQQAWWSPSDLRFVALGGGATPSAPSGSGGAGAAALLIDAIQASDTYSRLNLVIYRCIDELSPRLRPRFALQVPAAVELVVKRRDLEDWPKTMTLERLEEEFLFPLLQSSCLAQAQAQIQAQAKGVASDGSGSASSGSWVGGEGKEWGGAWALALRQLCDVVLKQMCALGELLLLDAPANCLWQNFKTTAMSRSNFGDRRARSRQLAVLDVTWLTSRVLGRVFRPSSLEGAGPASGAGAGPWTGGVGDGGTYSYREVLLSLETISARALGSSDNTSPTLSPTQAPDDTAKAASSAELVSLLPLLLEAIGAALPLTTDVLDDSQTQTQTQTQAAQPNPPTQLYFPSFCEALSGPEDLKRIPSAARSVQRRFRLRRPAVQVFPPGYWAQLFCSICALEPHSRRVRLFADGMDLLAAYSFSEGEGAEQRQPGPGYVVPLPQPHRPVLRGTLQLLVVCSRDGCSFDVMVNAGPNVLARDGRVWQRLQQIRAIVLGLQQHQLQQRCFHIVQVDELCVHPSDSRVTQPLGEALKGLSGSQRDETCSLVFGELSGGPAEEPLGNNALLPLRSTADDGTNEGLQDIASTTWITASIAEYSLAARDYQLTAVRRGIESLSHSAAAQLQLLREIVLRRTDLPGLPLLLRTAPKKGFRAIADWRHATEERHRLFFVCPVTLQIAASGPKGRGYKVSEPRVWVKRILPALQVGLCLLSIGLKLAGVPIVIPLPSVDWGSDWSSDGKKSKALSDSGFLSAAFQLLSRAQAQTQNQPTQKAAEASGESNDASSLEAILAAMRASHPVIAPDSFGGSDGGGDSAGLSKTDEGFEALKALLLSAGDPMPNGRPLYSGLLGPVVSPADGSVGWISQGEGERRFIGEGRASFAFLGTGRQ